MGDTMKMNWNNRFNRTII